ncbi:MAG: Molybdenum cofactor cytidylyltransferase [Syntrophorhabdus sp. PtaB.Bin027]|jgi:molybdenum cofactor cytidylyltransferase|nr:MAG: Molybdenum cofactor cytidylyltransferase [Syntrophorhabdus sp. PtaB.Bin027]
MKMFLAIILAAGTSSRLGFNKLTVFIDGESVIRRSVTPFLMAEIDRILVVTGNDSENVKEQLEGLPVSFIYNPCYKKGMSSSIKTVTPFLEGSEAVLFHLGDKPFVSSHSIKTVLNTFRAGKARIVLPRFDGKTGHPVMISTKLLEDEIGNLHGDRGLREVIEKYKQDVVFIEGDTGNLFDIDTIQVLDQLRERGYTIEENKR